MHTHFHPPTNTWYTPAECGNCGATIQAPNAVKLLNADEVDASLRLRGKKPLVRVETLPPEGYYDERTPSEESCDACGGESVARAPKEPHGPEEASEEDRDHAQAVFNAGHLAGVIWGHMVPCEVMAGEVSQATDKELYLAVDLIQRFTGPPPCDTYVERCLTAIAREFVRRAGHN